MFQQSPLYNRMMAVDWCKNCPRKMDNTCIYQEQRIPVSIKEYFNQFPTDVKYNTFRNMYYVPYEELKRNFVLFWNNQYRDQKKHDKELEEIFDEAVDKVAEMSEDELPELSFVLYGHGYLKADNLVKAVEKVRKLIEVSNILREKYGGCSLK